MNQSLLRQPLKTYSYQFWGFQERLNGFTWIRRVYDSAQVWPLRIHPRQAGYVSGMLAPVGIGITGALLIVGALYSIRMIHRKRRNSFKHQRRKVRQPEVNTTSYYFSFTFDGGSALHWALSVPFFFPQQPREPGTSRQDQAMLLADSSEDEFWWDPFFGSLVTNGWRSLWRRLGRTLPSLWLPHLQSPRAVWLWLIWSTECDRV